MRLQWLETLHLWVSETGVFRVQCILFRFFHRENVVFIQGHSDGVAEWLF